MNKVEEERLKVLVERLDEFCETDQNIKEV